VPTTTCVVTTGLVQDFLDSPDFERTGRTIPAVAEWLTDGCSANETVTQELLDEVTADLGPGASRADALHRAAELLLLEAGVTPAGHTPITSFQGAAKALARDFGAPRPLLWPTTDRFWSDDEVLDLANHLPGVAALFRGLSKNEIRKELVAALAVIATVPGDVLSRTLGNPEVLAHATPSTSFDVLRAASVLLSASAQFIRGVINQLLFDFKDQYPNRYPAIDRLYALHGDPLKQRLGLPFLSWDELEKAAARAVEYSQPTLGASFEFDEAQSLWIGALAWLYFPDRHNKYFRVREWNTSGGKTKWLYHRTIRDLTKAEILERSGMAHADRSAKENYRIVCDWFDGRRITLRDLNDLGETEDESKAYREALRPLVKLLSDAIKPGAAPRRSRRRKAAEMQPVHVVSAALNDFHEENECAPSVERLRGGIPCDGGTVTLDSVNAAFPCGYDALLAHRVRSGMWNPPKPCGTSNERIGGPLACVAFGLKFRRRFTQRKVSDLLDETSKPELRLGDIDMVIDVDIDGERYEMWIEFDGEYHFGKGHRNADHSQQQRRDRRRDRQLLARRKAGHNAVLVRVHHGLLKTAISADTFRDCVSAAVNDGATWIHLRRVGCGDMIPASKRWTGATQFAVEDDVEVHVRAQR
jgi:hypothetical protein